MPSGTKSNINSATIHLLNLKEVFSAFPNDNEKIHEMNFVGISTSYNLPRVSQEEISLRLFPFSLIREAILCLAKLPYWSITTLSELKDSVMGLIFPPSRILQLKDKIYKFRHFYSEVLYKTRLRFKKKLLNISNHRMTGRYLLEIFY